MSWTAQFSGGDLIRANIFGFASSVSSESSSRATIPLAAFLIHRSWKQRFSGWSGSDSFCKPLSATLRFTFVSCILLFRPLQAIEVGFAASNEKYLGAAKQAANWLISLEGNESTCNGLSWPRTDISSARLTGLDEGAVGIGTFFLKLYQVTGEQLYLDQARRAANYVYQEYAKGNFNGPDWLGGAAGGGTFFLSLYKETEDTAFLEKGKFVARWLMNNSTKDGSGYYWRHYPTFPNLYTGMAHGAAGIGSFFLDLYEVVNDSSYLEFAEGAYRWMRQYAITFDDSSIGWKRLTTDTDAYHLWGGGSTGIIFFIDHLYAVTQKELYLEDLSKTSNGLVRYAVLDREGCCWSYTTAGGSFPIIYCHGTTSTVEALYLVYSRLQNERYLNYSRLGAQWVKNVKKVLGPSEYYWAHIYNWDQFDTGLLTGTASVGHGFLRFYAYDQDGEYLKYARAAGDYLLRVADKPVPSQMCWINYTNPLNLSYDQKAYYTGWYAGAAGIGIFLLELYQTLNSAGDHDQAEAEIPIDYMILRNYPNPFNSGTTVFFNLLTPSKVDIEVYDLLGGKVRTLAAGQLYEAGRHSLVWDSRDNAGRAVASGIYFARLNASTRVLIGKMVLIR
jgi:hypothetical protein